MSTFKSIALMLCLASFTNGQLVSAQTFQGEITYKTTFISHIPGVSDDSLQQVMGRTHSTYLISDEGYKTTYYNGDQFVYSYTYEVATGRMYDASEGKGYITWRDSRKETTPVFPITVNRDTAIKVLGKRCYLVTHDGVNSTRYLAWYSNKLRVDYRPFVDHAIGNWNGMLKATDGGLPLKSIVQRSDYTEIIEAVAINKRQVAFHEFSLPPNKKVAASINVLDEPPSPIMTDADRECYRRAGLLAKEIVAEGHEPEIVLIRFFMSADGQIGEYGFVYTNEGPFHKLALDCLLYCVYKFTPATLNGLPVDSELIIPFNFVDMTR